MNEHKYNGFSERSLRRIALRKVNFKMSVNIHVSVFITVCIFLSVINLVFTPMFLWVLFPIFAWLIGVAEHITSYLIYARGVHPSTKRGVIFHSVAYIFTMLFFFVINSFYMSLYYWAIFPAFFWGTGLVIHLITYLVYHRPSVDKQGAMTSRRERAVEKEMEKMQNRLKKE